MTEPTVTIEKHVLWIREHLIPTVIDKQREANPTKDVKLQNSTVTKFTNDGGYIITLCYKVIIELHVDGRNKTISFFVKITPELPKEEYDLVHFEHKFRNETIAYEDILPSLGSPEDFPMFYFSKIETARATIAISDFSVDGFSMSKATVDLSLDHILVAMKALGKFHGASFALKHTDRKRFDALRNKMCTSALQNRLHPTHELTIKNSMRRALNHFRQSNDAAKVPETFLQKLEDILVKGDKLFEYISSRAIPVEPMAVICHGDFLRNNIAFAYDNEGLATNAMLFDFQTILYATPMVDVCMFMANSTGHDTRKKHFDEIFRTYHDTVIEQFLERTGLNADSVPENMSYDKFLREYTIQMPYGFSIAAFFIALLNEPIELLVGDNFEQLPVRAFTLGGSAVDHETQAQIREMYELHKKFDLKLLDDA